MHLIKNATAYLDALVPDAISSAFSEDLFVELTAIGDFNPNQGDIIPLVFDGHTYSAVFWAGKARVYFDNIKWNDFSYAAPKNYSITSPFKYTFNLSPCKSIYGLRTTGYELLRYELLPLWNVDNVFSFPYGYHLATIDSNDVYFINTYTALRKSRFQNLKKYVFYETAIPETMVWIPVRTVCDGMDFFTWIDDDGNWRSWYFMKVETKVSVKSDMKDYVKNTDSLLNERTVQIDLKGNTVNEIYTSGNETQSVTKILNSIKSSSYVFRNDVRVNILSEQTTDINRYSEFIFTIQYETKTAR